MNTNKWVTVTDAAGVERTVRRVDAKEIQEIVAGLKPEPKEKAVEAVVEVDDHSVAPKAAKAKK